ncbi:hypothetical protein [Streptomyces sp. NPDC093093]|uniref:hypothetical protein n=1 Tax=Streptomyces sp. NPDC093093 TaxID=3366025 RepID=UPI00380E1795
MTVTVLQNLLTGFLTAMTSGLAAALPTSLQSPAILLGLATLTVPALRAVLRYRLQAKAVDKAATHDLPALFNAFSAAEADPADQQPPPPATEP